MKISLLTYGTRGDVQPYIAVGDALRRRGHDVVLAAHANLVDFVQRAGLRCVALPMDSQALLEGPVKPALANGDSRQFLRLLAEAEQRADAAINQAVLDCCADADAIVSSLFLAPRAVCIAEQRRVPLALLLTFPTQATRAFPTPYLNNGPPSWLARLLGRHGHDLILTLYWRRAKRALQAWREQLGLPRLRESAFRHLERRRTPMLHMWSPAVLPRPADWADYARVTGYCRLSPELRARLGEGALPTELMSWLEAGTPPVFLGFGSMPVMQPQALLSDVARATARLGLRAIVGAGWSRFQAGDLPAHLRLVGAVNHDLLLPRCAAAVHHGGAGTTAASLTAGLPTWICSVFADQPLWGSRVQALGVGGTMAFRRLDAGRLEGLLGALRDPRCRAHAAALGQQLRGEDATEETAVALEAALQRAPLQVDATT